MRRFILRATNFFDIPLDVRSRVLILVAALLLVPTFFTPLWEIRYHSPRFPEGLTLDVYSHALAGGRQSDLSDINGLHAELGMRPVDEARFLQFRLFPFVIGVVVLLALRAVVMGKMSKLVDLFFLITYSCLFALWTFQETLSFYGHTLNPAALVHLEPFTPSMVGTTTAADVTIRSMPQLGGYLVIAVPLVLLAAVVLSRSTYKQDHQPRRDYLGVG